jgi:hypothetical protein
MSLNLTNEEKEAIRKQHEAAVKSLNEKKDELKKGLQAPKPTEAKK